MGLFLIPRLFPESTEFAQISNLTQLYFLPFYQ